MGKERSSGEDSVVLGNSAAALMRGETKVAMDRRSLLQVMGAAAIVPLMSGSELKAEAAVDGVDKETVYELRIYHTPEGKLEPLLARFRGSERKIFERLGMHCVAFWTATDEPLKGRTLIYML